jgi:hypothetical protein
LWRIHELNCPCSSRSARPALAQRAMHASTTSAVARHEHVVHLLFIVARSFKLSRNEVLARVSEWALAFALGWVGVVLVVLVGGGSYA